MDNTFTTLITPGTPHPVETNISGNKDRISATSVSQLAPLLVLLIGLCQLLPRAIPGQRLSRQWELARIMFVI